MKLGTRVKVQMWSSRLNRSEWLIGYLVERECEMSNWLIAIPNWDGGHSAWRNSAMSKRVMESLAEEVFPFKCSWYFNPKDVFEASPDDVYRPVTKKDRVCFKIKEMRERRVSLPT